MEIRFIIGEEIFYKKAFDFVVRNIKNTLKKKDNFTLVLAGGNTPIPLYEKLATVELPWKKVHLFWGDERFLPVTDDGNNFKRAYEAFISKINIPPENIHRIRTEFSEPEICAQEYEKELLDFFGTTPEFDLTILGMGADGHTASIFPKSDALNESKRLVVATPPLGNPRVPRITLTLKSINNSKNIIFLIAGLEKLGLIQEIVQNPEKKFKEYPATLVKGKKKTIWFVKGGIL
jgi:6-phosphogluconolactonase